MILARLLAIFEPDQAIAVMFTLLFNSASQYDEPHIQLVIT